MDRLPDPAARTFGAIAKFLRRDAQGISQGDVASAVGLKVASISAMERGAQPTRPDLMSPWEQALHLPGGTLLRIWYALAGLDAHVSMGTLEGLEEASASRCADIVVESLTWALGAVNPGPSPKARKVRLSPDDLDSADFGDQEEGLTPEQHAEYREACAMAAAGAHLIHVMHHHNDVALSATFLVPPPGFGSEREQGRGERRRRTGQVASDREAVEQRLRERLPDDLVAALVALTPTEQARVLGYADSLISSRGDDLTTGR